MLEIKALLFTMAIIVIAICAIMGIWQLLQVSRGLGGEDCRIIAAGAPTGPAGG